MEPWLCRHVPLRLHVDQINFPIFITSRLTPTKVRISSWLGTVIRADGFLRSERGPAPTSPRPNAGYSDAAAQEKECDLSSCNQSLKNYGLWMKTGLKQQLLQPPETPATCMIAAEPGVLPPHTHTAHTHTCSHGDRPASRPADHRPVATSAPITAPALQVKYLSHAVRSLYSIL